MSQSRRAASVCRLLLDSLGVRKRAPPSSRELAPSLLGQPPSFRGPDSQESTAEAEDRHARRQPVSNLLAQPLPCKGCRCNGRETSQQKGTDRQTSDQQSTEISEELEEAQPTGEARVVSFLMLFYLSLKNCVRGKYTYVKQKSSQI